MMDSLLKKEDASLALMNYNRSMGMRPQGNVKDKVIDKEFAM
jgi:hypothetical protein